MSILANGTEDFGTGPTPAQLYGALNEALQKLALMNLHEQVVPFFGLVHDGQVRGKSAITIERVVTAVEIRVEGDPPGGAALIVQININGTLQTQQFSVTAGNAYSLTTVSGDVIVPANQYAAAQITTASGAGDVVVILKSQLRIL